MGTETWLPVPGYECEYEVSDQGRVRSQTRTIQHRGSPTLLWGRLMSTPPNKDGYPMVTLCRDGKRQQVYVHDLVAAVFLGPKPEGMQVRHRNDIKADCRAENLLYGTRSQNQLDAVANGIHPQARKTHCPRGHRYDEENTYRSRQGRRYCRTCARNRKRVPA